MAFSSYEELKAAVDERRKSVLTLEVDLGSTYNEKYEDAKRELATAKTMKTVVGGGFLGGDNIEALEAAVAAAKPEPNAVWVQYHKLGLDEWAKLTQTTGMSAIEQYEKVLPQTFIGVYGSDPTEAAEGEVVQPLSTDGALMSSRGPNGILPGGALASVVQAFMAWQNSGGDVTIRPTKSGLV